jgi:hypothetical protein
MGRATMQIRNLRMAISRYRATGITTIAHSNRTFAPTHRD